MDAHELEHFEPRVLICLLGSFRVTRAGTEVSIRQGGKAGTLLASLALRDRHHATRESLLEALWPDAESGRSSHTLSSLVHELGEMLRDALDGAPPVISTSGGYSLNVSAGVGVDVAHFDALASAAESSMRAGRTPTAVRLWRSAVTVYQGDLCGVEDMRAVVERERLRATYLTLLVRLADQAFRDDDYRTALDFTRRLLVHDPCREDAHRLSMRCYVRLGERAQALRQYRTCRQILQVEFDAPPETLTDALFERVRLDPEGI
jgi:DNA-binding SARP family transcriptional activator